MSSWIEREINRKELQIALQKRGLYKGPIDGILGQASLAAMQAFERQQGFTATSYFDPRILPRLGLTQETQMPVSGVPAQIGDYILNLVQSKIAWAAAAMVALAVGWINTRFGFQVPQDIQNLVTGLIVSGGGALILILRGWFNNPKVVDGTVVK